MADKVHLSHDVQDVERPCFNAAFQDPFMEIRDDFGHCIDGIYTS